MPPAGAASSGILSVNPGPGRASCTLPEAEIEAPAARTAAAPKSHRVMCQPAPSRSCDTEAFRTRLADRRVRGVVGRHLPQEGLRRNHEYADRLWKVDHGRRGLVRPQFSTIDLHEPHA